MRWLRGKAFKAIRNHLLIELTGLAVKLLWLTVRFEAIGFEAVKAAGFRRQGVIYVFWHNTLLMPLGHECRRSVHAVISAGKDGEFAARVLRRAFGVQAIRGSNSRGGAQALLEMVRARPEGASLAFTPDGPRGPRYTFHPGSVWVAAQTGLRVVPLGASASRVWHLKSWDRFRIPKPFSRVVLHFGTPLEVRMAEDRRDVLREGARVEAALRAASMAAAARTGEAWPDAPTT